MFTPLIFIAFINLFLSICLHSIHQLLSFYLLLSSQISIVFWQNEKYQQCLYCHLFYLGQIQTHEWFDLPNVLDDPNSLQHHIVDLGLDQIQQGQDESLSTLLYLDSTSANSSDRLPDKVTSNLSGIRLQLREHLGNVGLTGHPNHNVQLDVGGVILLDK